MIFDIIVEVDEDNLIRAKKLILKNDHIFNGIVNIKEYKPKER